MADFILLLRGINVGGRNRLPMADLRKLAASTGLGDAVTYLQSGNLVCMGDSVRTAAGSATGSAVGSAAGDAAGAADRLADTIRNEAGLDVPVVGRTATAWASLIAGNPLLDHEDDPKKLHVTFLSAEPDPAKSAGLVEDAAPFAPERLELAGPDIYLHCPGGYADTPLQNSFFERRLGVTATTRNWRTVLALAELAGVAGVAGVPGVA